MKLQSLAVVTAISLFLTACASLPSNNKANSQNQIAAQTQPILYTEPKISAPFYALNPNDYSAPSEFEVNLFQAAQAPVAKLLVKADPSNPNAQDITLDHNRLIIPLTGANTKALKYAVLAQDNELDVTEIDDLLNILEGQARHYPAKFTVKRERTGLVDKLKPVIVLLDQHAIKSDASYDVIYRAMKANHMARNLDMGEAYGPKVLGYATRLLKTNPKDPEVNFWFGFGLSEGGALKEATNYLKVAMDAGIQEAHLSMVNNYLYLEQKKNALTTLKNYKVKYPDEAAVVDQLVTEIESGQRYNVWQIIK